MGYLIERVRRMTFWRRIKWTAFTCSFVVKDALRFHVVDLLPALLTLWAYLLLSSLLPSQPLAFVLSYAFGFALSLWLRMPSVVSHLHEKQRPVWLGLALALAQMAVVLWLESPAASLRIIYAYSSIRAMALLLDLTDGNAAVARSLWPDDNMRTYDKALTPVFFLRDLTGIALAETVIATGSMPLLLTFVSLWNLFNRFLDRATVMSVLLWQSAKAG